MCWDWTADTIGGMLGAFVALWMDKRFQASSGKPLLVLDKSIARKTSARKLTVLDRRYHVLVPSAFYFEVLKNSPVDQRRVTLGFPLFQRLDVSSMLQLESDQGLPLTGWPKRILSVSSQLQSGNWKGTPEQLQAIERYRSRIEKRMNFFQEVVAQRAVIGFSNDELVGIEKKESLISLSESLRCRHKVGEIAKGLGFPHWPLLDESWLHFRHYQALIQHALILLHRFPKPPSNPCLDDLRHDICDLEYLVLGLHAGILATDESESKVGKLGWRFKNLLPSGNLISTFKF
jgi:hypothetical protein